MISKHPVDSEINGCAIVYKFLKNWWAFMIFRQINFPFFETRNIRELLSLMRSCNFSCFFNNFMWCLNSIFSALSWHDVKIFHKLKIYKKSILLFQIPTHRCSHSVSSFHRSHRVSPTPCPASTWSCAMLSCGVNSIRSAPRWSSRNVEGEQTISTWTLHAWG